MYKLLEPKFYKNIDSSHCVQACLKSLFSILLPDRTFSWKALEELTEYMPGHGAWVYPELLAMNQLGVEAHFTTGFDCRRFISEGFDCIEDEYGKEVADYERAHPHDYKKIQRQMQEALDKHLIVERPGTKDDIVEHINNEWYVMLLVNSKVLNNKQGCTGHRILAYGYDDSGVIVHDPGSTHAQAGRRISWDLLEKAWAYPNENAKEMLAVRSSDNLIRSIASRHALRMIMAKRRTSLPAS